ncbi:prostaglandin reductase 1-like isoform X1 [Lethenteron reissneri]|uniref:prostaglandin reductase 1-like isoform X1 n=1 Tax=Lethenteron reissneri TaxID=7753 RepID=UPI002AB5FC77|nr:prostaglandin reductase 1-like isoform X1 [Lethenteron reissneri]
MVLAKVWKLKSHFVGFPKSSDFLLEEEELPAIKDGELLLEAEFLSVDPYMRPYSETKMKEGDVMIGSQVAKVVASKVAEFPVGTFVVSHSGWRSHSISTGNGLQALQASWPVELSHSLALGVLGMPGLTAYFGLLEICNPVAGETVLVNGAAGAVGMLVGQIAKIKGCRVVGFAGSDAKVALLKELGFDSALNYRTVASVDAALGEAAPGGYHCFFDNVGGDFLCAALSHMKHRGRVSICGGISMYNDATSQKLTFPQLTLIFKELKLEGFMVTRWQDRRDEGIAALAAWVKEGKLQYRETVTEGFSAMPDAFMGLLRGENVGKAVVRA